MMRRRGPGLVGAAARTAVVAGTATAVSGRVARRPPSKFAAQGSQAAAPAPAPAEAEQPGYLAGGRPAGRACATRASSARGVRREEETASGWSSCADGPPTRCPTRGRPGESRPAAAIALVAVGLLAVFLAAGCGGSDNGGSSAEKWADDVCSSITTWKNSVTSATDSLKGGNLSEDSLRSAVDDVSGATNDFVDDVRGLGAPDTEAGEQAKDSLDKLADNVDTNVSRSRRPSTTPRAVAGFSRR